MEQLLDVVVVMFSDDEDKIREELKDLIDDAPIEEDESDADSEASGRNAKRKKSDDDDDELDDRLEDEDYELIEENLGVKVERVSGNLKKLQTFQLSSLSETIQASQAPHRRGIRHGRTRRKSQPRSPRRSTFRELRRGKFVWKKAVLVNCHFLNVYLFFIAHSLTFMCSGTRQSGTNFIPN